MLQVNTLTPELAIPLIYNFQGLHDSHNTLMKTKDHIEKNRKVLWWEIMGVPSLCTIVGAYRKNKTKMIWVVGSKQDSTVGTVAIDNDCIRQLSVKCCKIL